MSSTYSPSLRLELIGPGEQAGSWNTTTNTNLGTLIDTAVAGNVTVSVTSANQALTVNDGANDQARQAMLTLTTTTAAAFAIYAPPVAKQYIINNTTAYNATIFSSSVLGNTTAAGAGAVIPPGKRASVFSAGTVNGVIAGFFLLDALTIPEPGVLSVAGGGTGVSEATGGGAVVKQVSPTLIGPYLGTPEQLVGTNISGLAANLSIGGTAQSAITATNASFASSALSLNTGSGWVVNQSGANLLFSYNGVSKGYLSSTGSGSLLVGDQGTGTMLVDTAYTNVIQCANFANIATIYMTQSFFLGTTAYFPAIGGRVNIQWDPSGFQGIVLKAANGNFVGNPIAFINSANTVCGYISQTQNTIAFNSASDYRLKNSVAPMTGALAKVAQLKPCTFKWNSDNSNGQGFIAHELQAVVDDCVSGEKDALNADGSIKPQGVDTSFLIATLTAAIQELKALVDTQTARITALES